MKLIEAIRKIVLPLIKDQSVKAKVLSIDKTNNVCDVEPISGGAKYLDVKLTAINGETKSKIISYPKIGSEVIISIIKNNEANAYVSQVSEVESFLVENEKCKVLIKEDGSVNIDSDNIVINGGDFGGLIKVDELKKQLDKNTNTLKAIQNVFNAWVVAPGDGGSVLKGASTSFTSMPLASLNSIENKKVKHG